jgi:dTMP kinase
MSHYIAFEGIEGSGKSSVLIAVAEWLEADGHDVVRVREPGGGPTGEAIRHILLDPEFDVDPWTEALLFAAQRAQLAADTIRPALVRGAWVLADRSVYSSLAYQAVGRNLGMAAVRAVNEAALDGIWPELVVLLAVPPAVGLSRQAVSDRIGAEGIAFQTSVAGAFEDLAIEEPDRFARVDTTQRYDDVVAEVLSLIKERW